MRPPDALHDGVHEPVFWEGQVVGYRRRYSDTLLMFLLKGLSGRGVYRKGWQRKMETKFA
jgi:hypothetical protein